MKRVGLWLTSILATGAFLSGCSSEIQPHTTSLTQQKPFDFQKYLPFQPLLPTYTDGYKLALSMVESQVDPKHGDVFLYKAVFGNPQGEGITVTEDPPDVYAILGHTRLKYTVNVVKDNVMYEVSSTKVPKAELEKVAKSISKPATKTPQYISRSSMASDAAKLLDFNVVKPGRFYVPQDLHLVSQESAIETRPDTGEFEGYVVSYTHGLMIDLNERLNGTPSPNSKQYSGKTEVIGGVDVKFRNEQSKWDKEVHGVMFKLPHSNTVNVYIDNGSLSNRDFMKVVKSFIQVANRATEIEHSPTYASLEVEDSCEQKRNRFF